MISSERGIRTAIDAERTSADRGGEMRKTGIAADHRLGARKEPRELLERHARRDFHLRQRLRDARIVLFFEILQVMLDDRFHEGSFESNTAPVDHPEDAIQGPQLNQKAFL